MILRPGSGMRQGMARLLLLSLAVALLNGCTHYAAVLSSQQQTVIDRALAEYPAGFNLQLYATDLTCPTAIAFDNNQNLLVAEGGIDNHEPSLFGFRADGTRFDIYPAGRRLPFNPVKTGFHIYGPIGGMVAHQGKLYVSHRDENDHGVITAFTYDGGHTTIVGDLPAYGDFGVTDLAISPAGGRLYFGVASATNSGVVGLDQWSWIKRHEQLHDVPWVDIVLRGFRFDTPNPRAGLFGGNDIAVTGPFQPFGTSNHARLQAGAKPTAAIYSVDPAGGEPRLEAYGVRCPRGLGFYEYRLYITDQGMELRGTRPVMNDPDAFFKFSQGAWYGWPDYSRDLYPISDPRFQAPVEMSSKTGYPEVSALIDQSASGLIAPNRDTLLAATLSPLSGASKFDFAPASGPFNRFRGDAIIALWGDRAPFATSGMKLKGPTGYKLVRVNDHGQVVDFVKNTEGGPLSRLTQSVGLERPIDVKFGPDGALYILDFGKIEVKGPRVKVISGTGRIFRLVGVNSK